MRTDRYFTDRRHAKRGESDLKVSAAVRQRSSAEQASIDESAKTREVKQAGDAIAAKRILGKVRSTDLNQFALTVLLHAVGETPVSEAAKLLRVTEPVERKHRSGKDWATPFREWAKQSGANLHRAIVAIAYTEAAHQWSADVRQLLTDWLANAEGVAAA